MRIGSKHSLETKEKIRSMLGKKFSIGKKNNTKEQLINFIKNIYVENR